MIGKQNPKKKSPVTEESKGPLSESLKAIQI